MAIGLRRIVLFLAISSSHVLAQQQGLPLLQRPLQQTTPEAFQTRVESLQALVRACQADANACDPSAIGDDNKILSSPSNTYQVRWQWLRKLVDDARNPNLPDRSKLLDQASARLDHELSATSPATSSPAFAPARNAANSILARPEFRIVGNESWLARKTGEFFAWLARLLTATANFSHQAPWLAPLIEWTFIGLTAVFVIVWVIRTIKAEQLDLARGSIVPLTDWQRESAEWADLARNEADAGNWREAIHCLYWASIVVLESKRLWRRDFARTPREYVALLERNSSQQLILRKLTRIFERIWYGLRDAGHDDYLQALALFEALSHA